MKYKETIETLINGNQSDFKKWLKKCSKLALLDAIEYHQDFGKRHEIINLMRLYLRG